ncbi:MAG: hypothetical protein ACRDSJ_07175, partial [Rubrobacteraceae bacterium]
IQLAQAAPPENYTGPLPEDPPVETSSAGQEAPDARKPQSGSVAAIAGMTVLPDTGGLPLAPLAGAALILMVVGVIRR